MHLKEKQRERERDEESGIFDSGIVKCNSVELDELNLDAF